MTEITGDIKSGDYISAGRASKKVKDALKRIGADPAAVRRAMVAAYEAEMNVVIHAQDGTLRAAVTPDTLEVLVSDGGPGIENIEQAVREGYSTAPPEARELGFGAGMGLPNIQRNADRFSIYSEVGKGTRLHFTVFLKAQTEASVHASSVSITPAECKRCLRCLHVCPTQAIRIRDSAPIILPHLCVGCAACRAVCPEKVYDINCPDELPEPDKNATLVVPAALRGQFGRFLSGAALRDTLHAMGWDTVWFSDPWEEALADAVTRYASESNHAGPILSPVCPAVVNLIQVRYPSLLSNIPPFLTALESARNSLHSGHGVFVVPCAAQCSLVQEVNALHPAVAVSPNALLRALTAAIKDCDDGANPPVPSAQEEGQRSKVVAISGVERVCQFLDEVEDERVNDCGIVALYACDSGCFGAPVWPEHPEVSRYRSMTTERQHHAPGRALYRPKPLAPRAGLRLDADMQRAIEKLAQIDRIRDTLPGRDCGVCGSPTCLALAEDIVMNRTDADACVYKKQHPQKPRQKRGKETTS